MRAFTESCLVSGRRLFSRYAYAHRGRYAYWLRALRLVSSDNRLFPGKKKSCEKELKRGLKQLLGDSNNETKK